MNLFKYDEKLLQAEMNALGVKVPVMVDVLAKRAKDMPLSYLWFSVHWWALKDVLNRHGHNFGATDDTYMREQYALSSDALTLFAAYTTSEHVVGNYLYGSREIPITDDGDTYALFDPDMEVK